MTIISKYNQLKHFFGNILGMDDPFELNELCCRIEHTITLERLEALEIPFF